MKSRILFAALAVALCTCTVQAQIFTTADGPVSPVDNSDTFSVCQTITVPGGTGVIGSLVTVEITMEHTWIGDLAFQLTSPAATILTLLNKPGTNTGGNGNSDDLILGTPILYHDAAASGVSAEDMGDACAAVINGTPGCEDNYIPAPDSGAPFPANGTNLADFNGETADGVWTLCVGDSAGGDTGTLSSWRLGVDVVIPVELESFSVE
jgi:subtilisin-like proprotein convertase family protein